MSEATSLRRHLIDELRDLLDAEQQITRALPQFADAAATPALKQAFQKHLKETKRHIDRLNQALAALGETPRPKRCVGMRGLIAEGSEMMGTTPKGALRDAIMISGAQKVEHYEMVAYGTARTYAEVLGRSDVARLLADSLQEEKAADLKLTEIAEQAVNQRAADEVHNQSSGILDQSAEWVGSTVGAAARSVRRAAGAVGLRSMDPGQAVDTVRDAAAATADTVAGTAEAVVKRSRQLGNRAARSARSMAADLMPNGALNQARRPRTAKRTAKASAGTGRKTGRKK
jgi:ferritin-like metal-binding protein YciE